MFNDDRNGFSQKPEGLDADSFAENRDTNITPVNQPPAETFSENIDRSSEPESVACEDSDNDNLYNSDDVIDDISVSHTNPETDGVDVISDDLEVITENAYPNENSAPVFADNISEGTDNTDFAADNNYTYSYSSKFPNKQKVETDDKENEYIKSAKSMKRFAIISMCCALVISIASISLAGVTVFRHVDEKFSHFRQSNRTDSTNKAVSTEQFVPTGAQLATEEIAAKVGPAVVGIVNTSRVLSFFNQPSTSQSSGSGVIINENGYIVTNYHVIENADELKVVLNTGKECAARVIGYDSRSDLAVLKIEEKDLIYASFGDSSQVNVGQRVIAIGNPLGTELMGTVTQGIISAVNRTVSVDNKTLTLIQTDAAINNGNSGGPLVNAYGEIIGINSVKMAATGVEGIGFAIPSNEVKSVVDDLINNGYVTGRLMVGVSGTNITEKLSGYYDLPVGFYVNEVYEGYGAYLAGVQTGDVIIKCDGKQVETVDDINAIRDTHKVNDIMEIVVWRNGKEVTLKVKLMEENPEITQ